MSSIGVTLQSSTGLNAEEINSINTNLTNYTQEECKGNGYFHGIGNPTLTEEDRKQLYNIYHNDYASSEDELISKTRYLIAESAGDEKGNTLYGRLGSQNGYEKRAQPWYSHRAGWVTIFRPKDPAFADAIATAMEDIMANPYIGYDDGFSRRNTLYFQWLNSGCCINNIHKPCSTDCSATVYVAVQEALLKTYGYECRTTALMANGKETTTKTFTSGGQTYTDASYENLKLYIDIGNPFNYIDESQYTTDKTISYKNESFMNATYKYILNFYNFAQTDARKDVAGTIVYNPYGLRKTDTHSLSDQLKTTNNDNSSKNLEDKINNINNIESNLGGMGVPYGGNFYWFCEYDLKDFFVPFHDDSFKRSVTFSNGVTCIPWSAINYYDYDSTNGYTYPDSKKYQYTLRKSNSAASGTEYYSNANRDVASRTGLSGHTVQVGGLTSMYYDGTWIDGNKNSIPVRNLWLPEDFYDAQDIVYNNSYSSLTDDLSVDSELKFKYNLYNQMKPWIYNNSYYVNPADAAGTVGNTSTSTATSTKYSTSNGDITTKIPNYPHVFLENKILKYKKSKTSTPLKVLARSTQNAITPGILRRGDILLTRTQLGHSSDSYIACQQTTTTTTTTTTTFSDESVWTEGPSSGHIAVWI